MKKLISILLALFMVLSCFTILASCNLGGDGDDESKDNTETGNGPTESDNTNNGNESNTKPVEYLNIVKDGESSYQVVVSNGATEAASAASTVVVDAIKDISGVKLKRVTDNTSKYPKKSKEILIGNTGREESAQVLGEITGIGWKIKFVGSKLVVAASNDIMLTKACQVLATEILEKDGEGAKLDKNIDRTYEGSNDVLSLFDENGKFKYVIVYPKEGSTEVREAATKLRDSMRKLFDGDRTIRTEMDSIVNEYEILVGCTKRQESQDLYNSMGMLDMKSCVVGNKIVIGAASDTNLDSALNNFYNNFLAEYNGTYVDKKSVALAADYVDEQTTIDYMVGIPLVEVGEFVGEDDIGDLTHVFVWDKVESAQYSAYKTELEKAMTKVNDYEMADNKYTLYQGERANAYLTYLTSQKQVRLYIEKTGTLYPAKDKAEYNTVSGYRPTFYMLDVDSKQGGGTDLTTNVTWGANGGMCFAMKVADGSFVIIDGGYDTDAEADKLLKFLKDNTPAGETPVVSAWIITHQHGDHYGALHNMTRRHLNEFKVKAFYSNIPCEGHGEGQSGVSIGLTNSIYSNMKKWTGAVHYNKIHSGMTFYVADAKFECIFTHEDMYPATQSNVNDTSMVLRITHGGKTIMMLADIEDVASSTIEKNFYNADVLKSDIVQYSHHGYEGANLALYKMIQAPTVLWPVNTYSWQEGAVGNNIFKQMLNGGWWINGSFVKESYIKAIICAEEAHYKPYEIDLLTFEPPAPVPFSDFARSSEIYVSNYVDLYNKVKASDA